jgi:hypothetical protein
MAAKVTTCPKCGERVSQFAGGCAFCGADLDAHRRRLAERPDLGRTVRSIPDVRLGGLATRINPDAALVTVTVLFLLVVPFMGTLLAALGAWDRSKRGDERMRNVFLVLLALGVVSFFTPWQFGVLSHQFGG